MNSESPAAKATLLAVSTLTVMAGATIAPALPAVQAHFAAVPNAGLWVRLVLTLPALLIALGAPLAGWLVDRWGRRRLLLGALLLYGVAGSSGVWLDSIFGILAGRALLGVAVAGVMTSATTLIADYYAGLARARFMGRQAAAMALGGVFFLAGGGLLASLSWRLPFLIYLTSLVLLPLAWVSLPEPKRTAARPRRARLAGETRADAGLQSLLVFLYGIALLGMAAFYMIPVQLPFYLEAELGASPSASGIAIAVSTFFGAVASLAYGRVRGRIGFVAILALVFGLMAVGYLGIGLANRYTGVLVGLAIGGLGTGMLLPNLNVWLTSAVPAVARGRALGGLTTAIFLGQFLSPLATQPLVAWAGVGAAFEIVGGLLAVASLLLLALRRPLAWLADVSSDVVGAQPAGSAEARGAALG